MTNEIIKGKNYLNHNGCKHKFTILILNIKSYFNCLSLVYNVTKFQGIYFKPIFVYKCTLLPQLSSSIAPSPENNVYNL